ncbi:hypothetical protein GQ42DRAFT_167196 [Ramicandelaber brevisporus]|nr:hypothetical protein GQ42DRAFT_167196 [Ramicandelaber brevisporus]
MKDLGNATLRAELGRSTWHLLHTTAGRFPIKPTTDEQKAMKDYLFLLSRLYPCGGCAKHFQQLLKDFPPVVTGREELKKWMCEAHNIVNERLKKPQFDCSKVDDRWDCGCGPELPV